MAVTEAETAMAAVVVAGAAIAVAVAVAVVEIGAAVAQGPVAVGEAPAADFSVKHRLDSKQFSPPHQSSPWAAFFLPFRSDISLKPN